MPDVERTATVTRIVAEVARHHASERRALPYIASLLPKVAGRFRGRDARVDVLCDAGQDLVDTLETYMDHDERLLPVAAARGGELVRDEIGRHDRELEALLAHVRSLARGFVVPEWGDGPYRDLMEELEALEREVKARVRMPERGLVARGGPGGAPRTAARRAAAKRALAVPVEEEEE